MKKYSLVLSLLVAASSISAFAKDTKPMTKKAIAIKTAKIAGYTAEVVVPIAAYLGVLKLVVSVNEDDFPKWTMKDPFMNCHLAIIGKDNNWETIKISNMAGALTAVGDVAAIASITHGIYGLQKELLQPVVKKLVQKYKARKAAKTA